MLLFHHHSAVSTKAHPRPPAEAQRHHVVGRPGHHRAAGDPGVPRVRGRPVPDGHEAGRQDKGASRKRGTHGDTQDIGAHGHSEGSVGGCCVCAYDRQG